MKIDGYVKDIAAQSEAIKEVKAEIAEVRILVAEQADALVELADIIAGGDDNG